jgi:cytosine/adenosine deaminase-related metal-dependent hydrolase
MMRTEQPSWSLSARWILPVDQPPIEGGIVVIQGERIIAVEKHGDRKPDQDLGDYAILPGLVNAHTHLDLTGLRGVAPPSPDFTAWLRSVIVHRRNRSPEQVKADSRAGLAESLRFGTTLLGDIAAGGLTWPVLAQGPMRAVVFYEVLGLPRGRAEQAWTAAEDWLSAHPGTATCRPGLSPHAPYSVSDWLFYRAAEAANRLRLPLATHLAETAEECELLAEHRGPFVDFLAELGVWAPDSLVTSPEEVGLIYDGYVPDPFVPRLYIHGNHLDPALLHAVCRGAVVYCPRTHAAFGHPPHPFRDFLSRGVRVALGTDSLASNPDLDLLAEARYLHWHYPDFPADRLLHMATLAGAEALGWADETGSLTPGKSADLLVVPLAGNADADPHRQVFDASATLAPRRVMFRGQWVWGDPADCTV